MRSWSCLIWVRSRRVGFLDAVWFRLGIMENISDLSCCLREDVQNFLTCAVVSTDAACRIPRFVTERVDRGFDVTCGG